MNPRIWRLENTVMDYPWGSRTAIAEILGSPSPAEGPQAELWMGAHPKAPSRVIMGGRTVTLPKLIREAPSLILGDETAEEFDGSLPFLFKILAAAEPLSIQAHPSREQARVGYEREERLHIPLSAPNRNYRDRNHKPEMLCALTPFWALKGFRPYEEIADQWSRLSCPILEAAVAEFSRSPDARGLARFFEFLLRLGGEDKNAALDGVSAAVSRFRDDCPEKRWFFRARERYPRDAGALCVFLLNLVELAPGEAIATEAGELHAYLEGTGVELMANSDNVLRGGLTPKHVDVEELLRTVRFLPNSRPKIHGEARENGETVYPAPFREFELTRVDLDGTAEWNGRRGVEIGIVLDGGAELRWPEGDGTLDVKRGDSFLVPAALSSYAAFGKGVLFRASVPALETDQN